MPLSVEMISTLRKKCNAPKSLIKNFLERERLNKGSENKVFVTSDYGYHQHTWKCT